MQSRCLVLSVKTPVLPHIPFYQHRAVLLHETIKDISQPLWAPTTRSPGLQSVHYVLDLLLERNTPWCPSCCCGWLTMQV